MVEPDSSIGSITFSNAVSAGSSWNDWKTNPTMRRRSAARPSSSSRARSMPSTSTCPDDGRSSPASSPSSVVLPEPEAPTIATASPGSTSKLTLSRIVKVAAPVATCLPRAMAFTIVCMSNLPVRLVGALVLLLLAAAAWAQAPVILVFGDSLSAGYGLPQGKGWVDLLRQRLQQSGSTYRVVNASISGETTLGGRSRLSGVLSAYRPQIVILELGANDALRGQSLAEARDNLLHMARAAKAAGAR